jgi:hypothetical protein
MDKKPLDDEALKRFVDDASHGRAQPKRYAAHLWRQLRRNAVMRDGIGDPTGPAPANGTIRKEQY